MASYINELKLKRSLRKVGIISIFSLVILIVFAVATFKVVTYVFNETQEAQIKENVNKYAINIRRKAQGDLKALQTLALFIKEPKDVSDAINSKTNVQNIPFEIVGFWNLDGSCQQVSLSGVNTDTSYKNLPPQVKLAVSSAWLGTSTVSAPYFSPTIGKNMITYVTPIYSPEGQIIGALSGATSQASFTEALAQIALTVSGVDTFLATSNGFIFSRGVNNILPEDVKYINKYEVLSPETIDLLNVGLVSNSPARIETVINGDDFLITLNPLGFSDWYIGTVSYYDLKHTPFFSSLLYLTIILIVVFALCAFVAIYFFINMKQSYRTQLLIAHYDPITNSYNYPKFLLEFDQLDYRNSIEPKYAVATLNIHDFSYIIDMLGEIQGDAILNIIAKICKEHPNVMMFCHHEADQFYLLLNLKEKETIAPVIHSIMDMCVTEIGVNISNIPIVMYSGVAFAYPKLEPDRIVSRAEFAKKQIVKSYNHVVRFYDENIYKKEAFLHSIEKSMRHALEQHEFKLFLQPKIDIKTGKVLAAEALVRWITDNETVVYPNDFIPLFEQNGFCTELDLYMFDKVCQKIRFYLDNNIDPIFFSINQTKLLIFQKGYTDQLNSILTKYNIPPKYIVIEVLEDLASHNVNELNHNIRQLKQLGLSIALDDFGSGYSSLNIVAGLDIDEIKFDREFLMVDDSEKLKKNQMILRVLSKLAKELGIRTVVEGVERNEDVEFLKTIDCDLAQGYYYDRPIPVEDFERKYLFSDEIVEKLKTKSKEEVFTYNNLTKPFVPKPSKQTAEDATTNTNGKQIESSYN